MEWMSISYIDLFKQQEFYLIHEHNIKKNKKE